MGVDSIAWSLLESPDLIPPGMFPVPELGLCRESVFLGEHEHTVWHNSMYAICVFK